MEKFEQRAECLARRNGFSWPIREEELFVEQIDFGPDLLGQKVSPVLKQEDTKIKRMWLEVILKISLNQIGEFKFSPQEIVDKAEEFFSDPCFLQDEFMYGISLTFKAKAWLKAGEDRPKRRIHLVS